MTKCSVGNLFVNNPTNEWLKVTVSNGVSNLIIPVIPPRSMRPLPKTYGADVAKIEEEKELTEEEISRYKPASSGPAMVENLLIVINGVWSGVIHHQDQFSVKAGLSLNCDKIFGGFRQSNGLFVVFFGSVDTRAKTLNVETHTSEKVEIPLKSSLVQKSENQIRVDMELQDRKMEFQIEKSARMPECPLAEKLSGKYMAFYETRNGPQELTDMSLEMQTTGMLVGRCLEQGLEHPIYGFFDIATSECFLMLKGRQIIYFLGQVAFEEDISISGNWTSGSDSSTFKFIRSP